MYVLLDHWSLRFISLAIIVAAVIDGQKLKMPNWLTLPLVLSVWTLGVLHAFGLFTGATRRTRILSNVFAPHPRG